MVERMTAQLGEAELRIFKYDPKSRDIADTFAYSAYNPPRSAELVGAEVRFPDLACLCLTYLDKETIEAHLWCSDGGIVEGVVPISSKLGEHGLSLEFVRSLIFSRIPSAASQHVKYLEYSLPQPILS